MPVQPFEAQRDFDQPGNGLVGIALLLQQRLAGDRLFERDGVRRVVRHQLAQPVDLAIGHGKHATDIAQHGAGLQLAECDDLRDPIAAVFLLDIADHLVAPVLAEIDVEIRHRDALGVEKSFEQQTPAQRVEIGDRQGPGDDRAGARAASRPDRDALPFRPLNEVGNDQEVACEAHLDDCFELEFEPIAIGFGIGRGESRRSQPRRETAARRLAQRRRLVAPGVTPRRVKRRQDRLAEPRDKGAAPGDDEGIVAGFRQIGEQSAHLGGRPEVMMRRQPPSVRVGDDAALRDA